jgi:Ca-activated chloride channel family protein
MKRFALTQFVTLAASLFIGPVANAAGMIMVDPVAGGLAMLPPVRPPVPIITPPVHPPHHHPTHPPRPVPRPVLKGNVSFGLHLQAENIKVDISDQVAKTYISQTFVNNTDQNLAGTYLFPLPEDTTFSSFSLHIDGKPIEGKILEANEARQQYEEIVRRMVDPGLLEYADYKTVRARIFPIPAHGTKKVELEYTQILKAENGMLRYRFPLKAEGQSAPANEIKVDVKLASKQGLRTIWSPSHTISSTKSDDHHAKIAFLAHDTVPDKDFLLYYSVSDKDLAANLLTNKESGQDGYFLLTLTPPVDTKQVLGKDIVLVADTSGSMAGEKMGENKKALKYVINALNANDHFNIVQFNTDAERFKTSLVQATPENKKAALAFIDDLEAHGGTNIGDALRNAVANFKQASERPAYIVLMTDGEPTVGETSVPNLLKSIPSDRDIRLFDFGVGYDVNTKLLNKLAEMHHGTSQYIEPNEDMETALSNFYNKIKSPVLTDVKIAYEGIQAKNIYPKEVTDLFAGTQALLIGRYKGAGKAVVRLTGKVNGIAKAYSFPLTFSDEESGHTYLPRLWAMRRIGYLTEVAQDNGNNHEVVDEIITLSKKYGIISAYTSFLVTDPSENHRLPVATSRPTPMPMPMTAMGGSRRSASLPPTAMSSFVSSGGGGPAASAPIEEAARGFQSSDARELAYGNTYSSLRKNETALKGRLAAKPLSAASPYPSNWAVQSVSEFKAKMVSDMASIGATGKDAVAFSKQARSYQWTTAVDDGRADKANGVKRVEDKTFYLKNGFWTDSAFESGNTDKAEVVKFGSDRYFALIKSNPGISKYLAVGRQVILVFKGHLYKIVDASSANG